MNKKASMINIIVWTVSVFIIIFFLAGYVYFHNTMTTALQNIVVTSPIVNITDAVQKTIVPINSALVNLKWISFILIIMLGFAILLENFFIREHPALFFVHILVLILAIIGAIYISNEYQTLMSGNILSDTINSFNVSSYIVLWLPLWVAVIGIFGLILLMINMNRDPTMRGGTSI